MDYVSIESLAPLSNRTPSQASDPASGTAFTEWLVLDEALIHLVIPEKYVPKTDVFLQIDEATASSSLRHAWEVSATLLRPAVSVASAEAPRETTRMECTSSESPMQLARRTIRVTGGASPGCVDAQPLQAGDILSVALRRAAVSALEDPLPVRVFTIQAGIRLSETRISDCPGRLGAIIDSVRDLFNETSQAFLGDDFILRSVNRCIKELAQEALWRRETAIPASVGVSEIDLLTAIPDLQDVHQVSFQRPEQVMECVGSFREFMRLRLQTPEFGRPRFYTVQGNTLHMWPRPGLDADRGFIVFHSHLPAQLGCAPEAADPPLPPAYDAMLARYVLKEAFLRDRHSPEANIKFQQYASLYEEDKRRLLGEAAAPVLSLRPGR